MQKLAFLFAGAFLLSAPFAPLQAAGPIGECGEPPLSKPTIPNGTGANADDMRIARNAILDYSSKIDSYLTCMDKRASVLFTYMEEEQRKRWNEDLSNLHEERRELQKKMNEEIRAYRNANS